MMRTLPPRQRALAGAERRTASTTDKGHGRLETRTLVSSTQLGEGYLDFPGASQCFKLTRTRTLRDRATGRVRTTTETAYGVTSLPRERAGAARLLEIVRGHWGIENKVHHVRDRTMGEDACRVRKRAAPVVLATIRNAVLAATRVGGSKSRAAQFRTFACDPVKALQAVQRKLSEN
jgi:hypothetical protein